MTLFDLLLLGAAVLAGAIASVSGFGVGSILTPLLAVNLGTKLAVAAVSIPHVVASGARFWQMRRHVDWRVVRSFGLTSAAGGLVGALLHARFQSRPLTAVFAILLVFAGVAGLTGLDKRLRFRGWMAWIAGAVSGVFGGLVGNQGGIRSAALLGFDLRRDVFVATATMVGLFVDGARLPAYLVAAAGDLRAFWPRILVMTLGVLFGTVAGVRVLSRIPEKTFGRTVSGIILLLGLWMGWRAVSE